MYKTIGLAVVVVVSMMGCKVNEARNMAMVPNYVAELQGAEKAYVNLRLAKGNLQVDNQALALMVAEFYYNTPIRMPKMAYEVIEKEGRLSLYQEVIPSIGAFARKDGLNSWKVHFEKSVPMELDVEFGEGKGMVDLRGLNLTRFKLLNHEGQMVIDLSSSNLQQDLPVWIDNEAGTLRIILPKNIPVRITNVRGGKIDSAALKYEDGIYTNGLPDGEFTMFIDIKNESGTVAIQ